MKTLEPNKIEKYQEHYSESGLWKKIGKVAKKAGTKAVYAVLLLYYVLMDKNTPKQYKATILGALGYFILPLDILPDAIPMIGFTDDLAALIACVKAVWSAITPDIKRQAAEKMVHWFGPEVGEPTLF